MNTLLRETLTSRVYEVARGTPLDPAPQLSSRTDNTVWLKQEDLQPIFSFKLRGAYNRMVPSLEAGRRVRLDEVGLFADGVAVQQVGVHTFPIVQETVSEIIRVTNHEVCAVGFVSFVTS